MARPHYRTDRMYFARSLLIIFSLYSLVLSAPAASIAEVRPPVCGEPDTDGTLGEAPNFFSSVLRSLLTPTVLRTSLRLVMIRSNNLQLSVCCLHVTKDVTLCSRLFASLVVLLTTFVLDTYLAPVFKCRLRFPISSSGFTDAALEY
ncbi:hypothetical protein V8E55_001191 [Tylopilus felleus]